MRSRVAEFLGLVEPERLVFTLNATDALNCAIKGLVAAGGRVVTSDVEHSAVMRPLRGLAARQGLGIDRLRTRDRGRVVPEEVATAARGADLVVLTCASNVTGVVQPWEAVDELLRPLGTPLLLDAAQAAGSLSLEASRLGPRTAVALTGHKGLLGPMGCGALIVGAELAVRPWREGGTGESLLLVQPDLLPQRLEAGTLPLPALAGLAAGIAWWREQGVELIRRGESELTSLMREGLSLLPGVSLPGPQDEVERAPLVSFTVEGYSPEEAAALLESEHGVVVRAGLHCARDAHETMGTLPGGTLRASVGPTTRLEDVEALLRGVDDLVTG